MTQSFDYKSAGVDIEAGEQAVLNIKTMVRSTFTTGVLTDIGRFGKNSHGGLMYREDFLPWIRPAAENRFLSPRSTEWAPN